MKLRVEDLDKNQTDYPSGYPWCSIDQNVVKRLRLSWRAIKIRGEKITSGIAVSNARDKAKRVIRLDEIQRLNAGVLIGEYVSIKKAKVRAARKVVLTRLEDNLNLKVYIEKKDLFYKPIVTGDIIEVLGALDQNSEKKNKTPPVQKVRLLVEDVNPSKIVIIKPDTLIKFHGKGGIELVPISDTDYYNLLFKVIMIGDPSSCKELLQNYSSGFFIEDYKLTIGVDFHTKMLYHEDKKIQLQLWDINTKRNYFPIFCRGSSGAIIMYDITNSETIKHLSEWIQTIRENSRDIPILLVGNKTDLEEDRVISKEDGLEINKKYNLSSFIEVSSETGENVKELFESLVGLIVEKFQ